MFEKGTLQERLAQYQHVKSKANKLGTLFGCFSAISVALIGFAALLSAENATVGALVGIAAVVGIDFFICYQIGKCYPWSYYFLAEKYEVPIPLLVTMFLGFYLGLAMRIKYHRYDKKLKALVT